MTVRHAQTLDGAPIAGARVLVSFLSHSFFGHPPPAPVPFSQIPPDIQAVLFPPTHPLHLLCPLHMLDSQKRLCGVTECEPVVRPLQPVLG